MKLIPLFLLVVTGSVVVADDDVAEREVRKVAPPQTRPVFTTARLQADRLILHRPARIMKDVEETYFVSVPVTKIVDGEKKVTERVEERKRMVKRPRQGYVVDLVEDADLKFEAVDGTEVTINQAAILLKSWKPVLLVHREKKLDPYFREILKRKTLIVYGSFPQG